MVRLGELDLNPDIPDGATPLDIPAERIITHAEYDSRIFTNDIALVKLNRTITFTSKYFLINANKSIVLIINYILYMRIIFKCYG